jgi:hypothetical protein
MDIWEIIQVLIRRAEEAFGKQRADELRVELEQMAAQLVKLYATPVDFEDEP